MAFCDALESLACAESAAPPEQFLQQEGVLSVVGFCTQIILQRFLEDNLARLKGLKLAIARQSK